ncbi:hypothetical protein ACQKGO_25935 [Corallococcus interemptor]|uniref:hypothetical protein n=1 Tax=Corallococcus interemptor TaxID=2316720 RepID=UPI003D0282EA
MSGFSSADFEEHEKVATRFGISAAHAREDRASQLGASPNATQIRLSDGLLAFEPGLHLAGSWRLNLHFIYVQRSPTGSNFGFYTAGQTGPTLSVGTDILL